MKTLIVILSLLAAAGAGAADDVRVEAAKFALALGAGAETRALAVDRLRCLETDLSKDAVVRAFAGAEME